MDNRFQEYNAEEKRILRTPLGEIHSFIDGDEENVDKKTVDSFGEEWKRFGDFSDDEIAHVGNTYFDIVPDSALDPTSTTALDVGCGSGRWTKYLANRVLSVECIDPSQAVYVAQKILKQNRNVRVTQAAVENIPFNDGAFDFVFSLGVLHHIPDTKQAIDNCVKKLRKDGYLLIYLYYNLDNRGIFFKIILFLVTLLRGFISKMPSKLKFFLCDLIAYTVYLPLIGISNLIKKLFPDQDFYKKVPLSYYSDKTLNIIRNDALDRFGTPLEQRFSKMEIMQMLEEAGLQEIRFSDHEPYWHAIGRKK